MTTWEACGPDTIGCQPGLECRPAPDGSGSFCRQDCRKAGPTTGCPVGQRCVDEGDSANPERGSCEPAPATTTIPPPVSGPGTTTTPDEGSAPAAPDVVSTPRVDARGEADADATDEGGGGCHLAPTGGSIPWPLVFSALAALAVVRRRL